MDPTSLSTQWGEERGTQPAPRHPDILQWSQGFGPCTFRQKLKHHSGISMDSPVRKDAWFENRFDISSHLCSMGEGAGFKSVKTVLADLPRRQWGVWQWKGSLERKTLLTLPRKTCLMFFAWGFVTEMLFQKEKHGRVGNGMWLPHKKSARSSCLWEPTPHLPQRDHCDVLKLCVC